MNSLDTNILLYATNADCAEHGPARQLVEEALSDPRDWIIADQVYFELYRLLRNATVLQHPLSAMGAWERVDCYRHRSGWKRCSYETPFMGEASVLLQSDSFPSRRTLDLVLAVTLRRHGVSTFYTSNVTDFTDLGWFQVANPLPGSSA